MKLSGLKIRSTTKAFVSPFSRPIHPCSARNIKPSRGNHAFRVSRTQKQRVISTMKPNSGRGDQEFRGKGEEEGAERQFKYRFDPESETDAFGRDPRKETEFWMDAAKNVLESNEVQEAIADHAAKGGDGLTDEQREYLDFIKSLDEESK